MARTARVVAAALVAALLLPAPGRAGSACRIAVDPQDDVVVERESVRATQAGAAYAGISPAKIDTPTATTSTAGSQSAGISQGSTPVRDDSVDLVSLDARVVGRDLIATMGVRDLTTQPYGRAIEYSTIWHVEDTFWAMTARRGIEGWSFRRGSAPRDAALAMASAGQSPAVEIPTGGLVEYTDGLITMVMPTSELGGVSWLEGMYAQAREDRENEAQASASTPVTSEANVDWTDDGRFPLSGPCPRPPTCPVATDAAGDAGLARAGTDQPETATPSLDVLTVGGTGDRDTIVVSVRVVDASAGAPEGFDTIGWTISWRAKGGGRWIAQAQRSLWGPAFSVAFDGAGTQNAVSGPVFGGSTTRGAVDTLHDVVSIVVPRSAVDSPGNGTPLRNFGASSWAATNGSIGAAGYAIYDTTEMGAYYTGVACSA